MQTKFKTSTVAIGITVSLAYAGIAAAEGNRYDLERFYESEISAAQAYLEMENSKGHDHQHRHAPAVLIDVRRLREYAAGHPEDAYNIPYPHIVDSNDQDPAVFYWEVFDAVKGKTDTPIMTLCRTGHRSVLAGNILADPEGHGVPGGVPFTHVRNIWEGFVGQYKYAYDGGNILLDENGEPYSLDLNNDGVMNSDVADVFAETKDANPDKDGWRNFQGLPWSTHIRRPLAYMQDPSLYVDLNLTPVE